MVDDEELIGKRFKSNQCGWFTVIEKIKDKKNAKYSIQFDEINNVKYMSIQRKQHILSGEVKNPYYPSILGVACKGDIKQSDFAYEYARWQKMIYRCYCVNNDNYKYYGGSGVTVCDRWLCFENFLYDLKTVEGYDSDNIKNLELDKDYKVKDNKIYNAERCIFISKEENLKEMHTRKKENDKL